MSAAGPVSAGTLGSWHVDVNTFELHATNEPQDVAGVYRVLAEWGIEVPR